MGIFLVDSCVENKCGYFILMGEGLLFDHAAGCCLGCRWGKKWVAGKGMTWKKKSRQVFEVVRKVGQNS